MVTSHITPIRETLYDCLAWCAPLRVNPPSSMAAWPFSTRWGCEEWTALLRRPDTLAALVRSWTLAEPALQYLPDDVRACYGPDYQVASDPNAAPATTAAFDRFVQARRRLVGHGPSRGAITEAIVEQELGRPRCLLLADWSASVWDGTAAAQSAGFVDLCDVPGWDTWLTLVDLPGLASAAGASGLCLVSWVPIWAGALVDEAIRVNPVACLSWGIVSAAGITAKGWGQSWDGLRT